MEKTDSIKQQEKDFEEYDKRHKYDYAKGRAMIYVIAAFYFIMCIIRVLASKGNDIFTNILSVVCVIALVKGWSFARYLYIIGGIINTVKLIYVLPDIIEVLKYVETNNFMLPLYLFLLGFMIISVALLIFNKDIKEYMYMERN